jgi:hypothetical protein
MLVHNITEMVLFVSLQLLAMSWYLCWTTCSIGSHCIYVHLCFCCLPLAVGVWLCHSLSHTCSVHISKCSWRLLLYCCSSLHLSRVFSGWVARGAGLRMVEDGS